MTRSGRLYRKSGKMASEELVSYLYNLACRYYIILDFLYLSGLSCVHFISSKSGKLKDFNFIEICGIKSLRMFNAPVRYIQWQQVDYYFPQYSHVVFLPVNWWKCDHWIGKHHLGCIQSLLNRGSLSGNFLRINVHWEALLACFIRVRKLIEEREGSMWI